MIMEKSCGAVIVRPGETGREYLVIHSVGGHWSLCKGHVEAGESEHETAVREIREETGLRVDFVENFRRVITYSPKPGHLKDVVFFLGRLAGGSLTCQPEEVSEAAFFPYEKARARLTHASDRDVLTAAEEFLAAL